LPIILMVMVMPVDKFSKRLKTIKSDLKKVYSSLKSLLLGHSKK
jgi:hypothetical protein